MCEVSSQLIIFRLEIRLITDFFKKRYDLCLWKAETFTPEPSVEDSLILLSKLLIGTLALVMLYEIVTLL